MSSNPVEVVGEPPAPPRPPTATAAPAPEEEPAGPWAGKLPLTPELDLRHLLPERSAPDILAAEIHFAMGRKPPRQFTLPVLSIAENREWRAALEGGLVALLDSLDDVGENIGAVLSAFSAVSPMLLEALISYDVDGILPPREELERLATEPQVVRAILEVWSAANPFAQVAVAAMRAAPTDLLPATDEAQAAGSSTPTNTSRRRTAGRRGTSRPS